MKSRRTRFPATYFVTGNDTGVGKTVVAEMLIRHLRRTGVNALAVKPFCTGDRNDARTLQRAQQGTPSLAEINPWFFKAPLAPSVAAARTRRRASQLEVISFLQSAGRKCDVLVVEGAGGLLTPLGEGYDARTLIVETDARPIVVCPNRLGALNQVRLVLDALPTRISSTAQVALTPVFPASHAASSNRRWLEEALGRSRVTRIPVISRPEDFAGRTVVRACRHLLSEVC